MAHVDLDLAKAHLNVEPSFTADDAYIGGLLEAAEAVVARDTCQDLDTLAGENGGEIPAPLRQAVLLLVGQYYENREPVAYAQASEVPLAYRHLVNLYRDYLR